MSTTPCPLRKLSTGSSRSPITDTSRTFQQISLTSKDNLKKEKADSSIGSWSPRSGRKLLWPESGDCLATTTPSRLDLTQPESMCGKRTPVSPVPSSSSVHYHSEETPPLTGNKCEPTPSPGIWIPSRQTSTYVVTTNCVELATTISNQLQWSEPVQFSGAQLQLVSHVEHGKKQAFRLMLKIQEPSGGTDTWAKRMLSLTNLEDPSISHTFSDGWIDTQYVWKTKVDHCHCLPLIFGSRPTWILECGIPS